MAVLGDGRARAWVLFQVDDPQKVAKDIYDEYGEEGGDDYVVVRADVVEGSHTIVVPVDAANEGILSDVIAELVGIAGGDEPVVLKVEQHNPIAPHDAHGYITQEEWEAGEDKTIKPGRQPQSPRDNAWG